MDKKELFRKLPSVDELLQTDAVSDLTVKYGQRTVKDAIRRLIDETRRDIASGGAGEPELKIVFSGVENILEEQIKRRLSPTLKRVVNATGIIVHTNLGRAPLSKKAAELIAGFAGVYTNLEFDIPSGERGYRNVHFEGLAADIFGADDAHVVNNNAAAVLLTLNTLAEGREVVVSRGEMIEIGGSFRIPDVIEKSGCVLREIGTTNKTKPSDYLNAVNEKTGAILKVHPSNYRIVGFTQETSLEEAVDIGRRNEIPVVYDMGGGNVMDIDFLKEPTVEDELSKGPDVLTFSGDKLLGSAQAGIILGGKKHLDSIKNNPLSRALRVDKLTIAALWGTLDGILREKYDEIPVMSMLAVSRKDIEKRSERFIEEARTALPRFIFVLTDGSSRVGGGAAPEIAIPTMLIGIEKENLSPDELNLALRTADPPVITRIREDRVLLDLRTVFPEEEKLIIEALRSIG